jgi:hypothetical protein
LEDTTIEDVLKTVEAFHNQKEYQKALATLEANQSKISPGVWHYNMGTEYGKLDNLPLARYHFLMAELKGLNSKEVLSNRNLIESKLDITRLEKPISSYDYFIKISLEASKGILTTVSLLLVIIGLFNLWKKSNFKALGICLFFALGFTGMNWWVNSWDKSIVMETKSVQEGPSAIFSVKGELPVGVMVITQAKGEWLEIIYPSRFQGWIKESGLKELK